MMIVKNSEKRWSGYKKKLHELELKLLQEKPTWTWTEIEHANLNMVIEHAHAYGLFYSQGWLWKTAQNGLPV